MRVAILALITLVSLGSGGCFMGRRKPVVQTPAPGPGLVQPPSLPPVEANEEPLIQVPAPLDTNVTPPQPPPTLVTPPETPPRRTTGRNTAAPKQPGTQATSPEIVAPAAPAPVQLAEILTPETRRQYELEFNRQMQTARAAIDQVEGKRLSASQRDAVNRIRTFIAQAQSAHDKDIVTALQLVRRADLLGQDLIKSVQ